MKVRFTGSAEADLERIANEIAKSDPERARLTVKGLRSALRSIGGFPHGCSPVPGSPGVRKKAVPPYVLLYTIVGNEIVLLRIAHERSDWISLI